MTTPDAIHYRLNEHTNAIEKLANAAKTLDIDPEEHKFLHADLHNAILFLYCATGHLIEKEEE